ncbi:hypothetical protein [Streptomyces cuspidosporus]|uniref:Uncharacterized protein n=1 Tax=Streptomyces cuspidosporus TaxID=66882 RepID=A0ABN3G9K1_9ACTN
MRNSIVRALATGAAAALLAGGAAATATSTAFAAPAVSAKPAAASAQDDGSTPSPTPTPHPSMTGKHCAEIKAHSETVTHNGNSYKLWFSGQKVCYMK